MPERKRLLITRHLPPVVMERARRDYDVVCEDVDRVLDASEIAAKTQDVHAALICVTCKFTADVIAGLPDDFEILSTFSVGTDHIDLEAARIRGLKVGCAPNGVTIPTAEIAFLLVLGAARRVREGDSIVRDGSWDGWGPTQLLGMQLDGKTLGVFGMGKIGQALAQRARGFGMKIRYHNRKPLPEGEAQGAVYEDSLEALLTNCDVVSVHAPATAETRHIINAERIALMKPGAILVNTARGDLVDDDALIAAAKSGHLGAIGLDVYEGEPAINPGYRGLENALLLPHLGSGTREGRAQMGFEALDNIDAAFAGKPLPYPVG